MGSAHDKTAQVASSRPENVSHCGLRLFEGLVQPEQGGATAGGGRGWGVGGSDVLVRRGARDPIRSR